MKIRQVGVAMLHPDRQTYGMTWLNKYAILETMGTSIKINEETFKGWPKLVAEKTANFNTREQSEFRDLVVVVEQKVGLH